MAENEQRHNPPSLQTDEEWRVHALNIDGLFLERWVDDRVRRAEKWSVIARNMPISFDGNGGAQSSEIDILAEREGRELRLTMPIECKKNNPEFIEWVFFERYDRAMRALRHSRRDYPANPGIYTLSQNSVWLNIRGTVADASRELRGTYEQYKGKDKTKTSNAAISAAARQVALAHQSLVHSDLTFASGASGTRMDSRIFIPVIVTTAHLSSTKIDPTSVDEATGEIPLSSLTFTRRSAVIFEYPLPPELQFERSLVDQNGEIRDDGSRLDIIVVHAADFPTFLGQLSMDVLEKLLVRNA